MDETYHEHGLTDGFDETGSNEAQAPYRKQRCSDKPHLAEGVKVCLVLGFIGMGITQPYGNGEFLEDALETFRTGFVQRSHEADPYSIARRLFAARCWNDEARAGFPRLASGSFNSLKSFNFPPRSIAATAMSCNMGKVIDVGIARQLWRNGIRGIGRSPLKYAELKSKRTSTADEVKAMDSRRSPAICTGRFDGPVQATKSPEVSYRCGKGQKTQKRILYRCQFPGVPEAELLEKIWQDMSKQRTADRACLSEENAIGKSEDLRTNTPSGWEGIPGIKRGAKCAIGRIINTLRCTPEFEDGGKKDQSRNRAGMNFLQCEVSEPTPRPFRS
ncbi:hypothetical protein FB451DRAFT_1175776 [Mycena latifolia]|nr:hypothetical protein FB451DRAFT_1175776 [Mycena latifolia]